MRQFLITILVIVLAISTQGKYTEKVQLRKSKEPVDFLGSPVVGMDLDRLDLKYPYLVKADFGSSKDNLMAVSLFNSHIFVSNCPTVFKYFNCSEFPDSCIMFPRIQYIADFPYYTVGGNRILLNITMGNFGKGNRVKAFYANMCTRNSYGNNDVVGSIGLSLNESNFLNMDTMNNRFSVWLANEGSDGNLVFGEDSDLMEGEPLRMMKVSRNWEIPFDSLVLMDQSFDFVGNIIFDLNSDFIGLPDVVYNTLLFDLKQRWNFVCDGLAYQPNCTYTKVMANLPQLTIMADEGNNPLTLPPDMYLKKIDNNVYKLLFVSLTNKATLPHQLLVTDTYLNYIIFGAPFFRRFYTVFNFQDPHNPVIDFYNPATPVPADEGGLSAWGIVGIVLGALLLIGIIVGSVYAFRKSRENRRTEVLVNPDTRVNYVAYNQ